jgi:tetratricopeptide (TPR) repeat protein
MVNDEKAGTERDEPLKRVLGAYYKAMEAGRAPSQCELLELHPELADELTEYFAQEEHFDRLTKLMREPHGASPVDQAGVVASPSRPGITAPAPGCLAPTWPIVEPDGTVEGSRPPSFGQYELLDRIGEGGMGVVYEARQRSPNRLVALKMIRAGRFASDDDLRRFRNEAQAAADLDHPHIVPIYEVGEHEGCDYFSMKLIDGVSLAHRLAEFRSDPKRAAWIVAKVARAIHHAHQQGVLHRDLKPSNILVDAQGEPFVSDFGLAKRVRSTDELTLSNAIPGTPRYMAPEQASGGTVTTATDVHGLGTILYALLTGHSPFPGDTVPEILRNVVEFEPDSPNGVNSGVDRDLETICLKCLRKEPSDRYDSAMALAEDLERWLRGEPIKARPVGPVVKAWRWANRNRTVAGLLTLVGILVIAGFVGLAVSNAMLARKNAEIARTNAELLRERNRVKQAVDDMYTQFAEQLLPNQPGMEKTRREFLVKALRYYEEEADRGNAADPSTQEEMANAYSRVGQIQSLLGEKNLAEHALRKSLSLFDQLMVAHRHDSAYQKTYLEALVHLADLLSSIKEANQIEEAERLYQTGIELCRTSMRESLLESEFQTILGRLYLGQANLWLVHGALLKGEESINSTIRLMNELKVQFPEVAPYRHLLARQHQQLGMYAYHNGDRSKAIESYNEAITIYVQLIQLDPRNPEYRSEYAGTLHNLAMVLHEKNRFEEAEIAYTKAIDLKQRLVDEFPSVPRYRQSLLVHLQMVAALLDSTNRREQAESSLQRGLSIAEKLVDDFPDHGQYRLDWINVLTNLANALFKRERYPEALSLYEKALAEIRALAKEHPDQPSYLTLLGHIAHELTEVHLAGRDNIKARDRIEEAIKSQKAAVKLSQGNPECYDRLMREVGLLADILLSVNEPSKAIETITEISRDVPDHPSNYFHFAILMSNWSNRLATDPRLKLGEVERKDMARAAADRAVESLGKAVAKGFKDAAGFKAQRAFDVLQGRDDFKQIVRQLEGAP